MAQNYDFSDLGGSQVHDFSDLGGTLVPDKAPQQPKQNAFMSGVDAFNAGAERIAHGALQPLLEGPLGERVKRGSQQYHQQQQDLLKQAQIDNPAVAGPAEFAGGIAGASPLYAIPGIGAGLMVRAITQGMLQGGLAGAAQYKNEGDSRLLNAGLGATIGAASYPVARGLSAANPAIKAGTGGLLGLGGAYALGDGSTTDNLIGGIAGAGAPFVPGVGIAGAKKLINAGAEKLNTGMAAPFSNVKWPWEEAAARRMLDKVNPEEAIKRKAASERLGLSYITPAEADGNPIAGAAQGELSRSKEGGRMLYEKGQQRLSDERKVINDLYGTVYPKTEKIAAEETAFYKAAHAKSLPDDKFAELSQDPVIKDAMATMMKTPAYVKEVGELKPTNLKYLDYTKRAIDDMIGAAERKGESNLARILTGSKKNLVAAMDKVSPEYAAGRELAARRLTRDELESSLNDVDVRGTNFYNKILKNDGKYEDLLQKVKDIPGAQDKLKDMRLVFKDLINPNTARSAAGLSKNSMDKNRNAPDAVLGYIKNFAGGKYDKAAVELITSPKWDKEFSEIARINNKENRAIRVSDLLAKIATVGGTGMITASRPQQK